MSNSNEKKQLLKDAAIVTILGGLLISLPLSKDAWGDSRLESKKVVVQDKEFIRDVFPAISSWEQDEAEPFFAEETIEASSDSFPVVLDALSASFGKLKSFTEPQLITQETDLTLTAETEAQFAVYEFDAIYEFGAAEVEIVLSEGQTVPEIYAVRIELL